jgi:hypothetical protein
VVDVRRELDVRFGVVERCGEQYIVDGIRRRLDASGPGEIFPERLANEVAQRYPPCLGRLGGPPVQVRREQELSSVHV